MPREVLLYPELAGRTLAKPLLNPMALDINGNPVVLFPAGFILTESAIHFATYHMGLQTAYITEQ